MWLKLTSDDVGAPTLEGVNGSLCNVLDWALPQASWAIEHTATNARVYRPSIGNRHRLHVHHDSNVSGSVNRAVVRGCEDATNATTLIDPFPQVAQVADGNCGWNTSNTTSASARRYFIYLSETFLIYCNEHTLNSNDWSINVFGDIAPMYPIDTTWATMITTRNSSTAASFAGSLLNGTSTGLSTTNLVFFCRDAGGFVKSTRGTVHGTGSNVGASTSFPVARGGWQNRIYREPLYVTCIGSNSASVAPAGALFKRGVLPNIWNPLHGGSNTLTVADSFSDNEYDPLALFRIVPSSTAAAAAFAIIEETDTWSPP